MKRRIIISSVLFVQVLLISCQKDYDVFQPDINNIDSVWTNPLSPNAKLNDLFDELALVPDSETIQDIALGDTLLLPGDILVAIPEKSCINNGGAPATGAAKLEFNFLDARGEFIRNGVPTSANENPLETSAEMIAKISQDGQDLYIANGKYILIGYRASSPKSEICTRYSENGNGYLDWTVTKDGSYVQPFSVPDPAYPTQYITGYDVKIRDLRWVNCGMLTDTTNRSKITATLPDIFTNSNTRVFVVFKDIKSVVQMKDDVSSKIFYANHTPLDKVVSLISISAIDSDYYLGVSDANTAANLNVPIKPQKKTYSEILEFLEKL